MNRTIWVIVVLVVVVAIGGYLFFGQQPEEAATAGGGATSGAAGSTAAVPEAIQAAVDFCKEKGGTVEVVTAAEGTTHLCVTGDGNKAEVSQFMADNQ